MQSIRKRIAIAVGLLALLYLLLLIPDFAGRPIVAPAAAPFAWNNDSLWHALEQQFVAAGRQSKASTDSAVANALAAQQRLCTHLQSGSITPNNAIFDSLLTSYFATAANVAAHGSGSAAFLQQYGNAREIIKQQSMQWDMQSGAVRDRLYRSLYGMRAAAEEVLLQSKNKYFPALMPGTAEPSATPAVTVAGIEVHSGDLFVSRGGAEVSAFISRGNNYPGNFSHVALLYVDDTKTPYFIEAHIEKGVAIATAAQYLQDKKLRFMVLRARATLPAMKANPLLPHQAAKAAYELALRKHVPYDFKMNFYDSSAMFCSEVGSYAYQQQGLQLWKGLSAISSPGVVNWLSDFGVENFVTQMPSDLEYDPQLTVVAEYRDPATLQKDHIDNAVMDALLEQADKGKQIDYAHWQLPLVRVVKGWCMLKNAFGGIGMIPEGMSATRALKNQYFVAMYNRVRTTTIEGVASFRQQHGYTAPYWQMLAIARKAAQEHGEL